MAVIHLRIDNRLIHGQVTVAWVNSLGADHLICTNDKVAKDPVQKMLLPQAARGIKTSVLSVADTAEYVKSEAAEKEKIMIIAKFPEDALALLEAGVEPREVNVGNQAMLPGTKPVHVTRSVAVTKEQAPVYRAIAAKVGKLNFQMMTSDSAQDFIQLMEKKGL
ncbi:MAG: PTS sugar transporter subunit IIB [Firmicutes bacterium]|nr:PTS sugar transporter subunit IIB [Bacillota bacterium]